MRLILFLSSFHFLNCLQLRSEVIATYALCGFANISSVGMMMAALSSLAPHRKGDVVSVALRALISGTTACFMTSCIAGILYRDQTMGIVDTSTVLPGGIQNVTDVMMVTS